MSTHKITTEQFAKALAIQVWGMIDDPDKKLTFKEIQLLEQTYIKEIKKGNFIGRTLTVYNRIKKDSTEHDNP